MRSDDVFHRHPVASRYRRVGQIGGLMQRFEHRHALAHAGGLDAKHLAAEIAAQVGDVVEVHRNFCLTRIRRTRQLAELFDQMRNANQLFGKVRAVFENIQREARHLRIGIEQREQPGIRHQLLEKMLKGSRAAPQLHEGDRLSQRGRAFIQKPDQIAGRRLHHFRRFNLRGAI